MSSREGSPETTTAGLSKKDLKVHVERGCVCFVPIATKSTFEMGI